MIDRKQTTRVFYDPLTRTVLDMVDPETGNGKWGGKTIDQTRKEYPKAAIIPLDEVETHREFTNERGNHVWTDCVRADRYLWDFKRCIPSKGWRQFDTTEDAWYFGVWVHVKRRKVVTYAEGDLSVTTCPTVESFRAEIADMVDFYDEEPPAWTVIDCEANTITSVTDANGRTAILEAASNLSEG